MTTQHSQPVNPPGESETCADISGNPLLVSMEMMRKAWAGLAGPGGLMQTLPITPPTNLEELDRRIAELRSVESWLRMNLSMLSSAIQAMEVQRATIATLRSFADRVSSVNPKVLSEGPSPLEVVLGLKTVPNSAQSATSTAAAKADPAAHTASHAWWNLLQQQFNQIAATVATMPPETSAKGTLDPSMDKGRDKLAEVPSPTPRKVRKTRAKGTNPSNK